MFFYPLTDGLSSLSNRFTRKGEYHDQAFAHLRQLQLKQEAVKSGADELGSNLRRLLIQPFKDASVGR
jgi:hypothetical protein